MGTRLIIGAVVVAMMVTTTSHAKSKNIFENYVLQTRSVNVRCLTKEMKGIIRRLTSKIGPIQITSGYRKSNRSQHGRCNAIDFRPLRVSLRTAIKVARSMPEVGGIGTYGGKSIIHIDARKGRMTWRH
jgi:uncharacterized protein YcbK (DUF882 family)